MDRPHPKFYWPVPPTSLGCQIRSYSEKRQVVYFFLAFMRRFMPDFLGAAAFLAFIRRFAMMLLLFCSLMHWFWMMVNQSSATFEQTAEATMQGTSLYAMTTSSSDGMNRARPPICIWSYRQCSKWTFALGYTCTKTNPWNVWNEKLTEKKNVCIPNLLVRVLILKMLKRCKSRSKSEGTKSYARYQHSNTWYQPFDLSWLFRY